MFCVICLEYFKIMRDKIIPVAYITYRERGKEVRRRSTIVRQAGSTSGDEIIIIVMCGGVGSPVKTNGACVVDRFAFGNFQSH